MMTMTSSPLGDCLAIVQRPLTIAQMGGEEGVGSIIELWLEFRNIGV